MTKTHTHRRLAGFASLAGVVGLVFAAALGGVGAVAVAAPLSATAPSLGAAGSFSVLGKAGVTNTGNSVLSGKVGADLDAAITGFPPGINGGRAFGSNVAQPEADMAAADLALTAQGPGTPKGPDLTGVTVGPGVYSVGAAMLTGVLTLDGPGVYIFLASSSLTSSGSMNLINGAAPCNVFWHVATLASFSGGSFAGTIIAGTALTFVNGVSLNGRALAKTANVTLINNHIFGPDCVGGPPAPSPTLPGGPTPTPTATATPGPGPTATASAPSYVDVVFACAVNGLGEVRVGLSAGVIVYGLGADITSATDTGANKIIRELPIGSYPWHAVPPAGHYMQNTASGVVDIVACPALTSGTAVPSATSVPVLLPVTGGDLTAGSAQAARQLMNISLGILGLGLVVGGFALRRKRAH